MVSRLFSRIQRSHLLLLAAFLFGIGVSFALSLPNMFRPETGASTALRQSDLSSTTPYHFIDPLLAINNTSIANTTDDDDLEASVRSFIRSKINSGKLTTASVMFTSKGKGFVINGDETYSPASLLKVPTLIAYYKLSEKDSATLSKKITYSGGVNHNDQEFIQSPIQLTKGAIYSVEELIEHMIKYSDNNAAQLLLEHLNSTQTGADTLGSLFADMGITQISLDSDFITVKEYSLFFRILYNATYLDKEFSEKALGLLAQTDFSKGITAAIPSTVRVAHKFGEFTLQSSSGISLKKELHDCGLVYYQPRPYLICIMTKGSDFETLEEVLKNISGQIFTYVESQNK